MADHETTTELASLEPLAIEEVQERLEVSALYARFNPCDPDACCGCRPDPGDPLD